ncbi:hypothetical protein SUGI_0393270 [Cryptomeria japonica]|nr:hypothetical protein SUGI_0393270 [Cryptomeria japonica]
MNMRARAGCQNENKRGISRPAAAAKGPAMAAANNQKAVVANNNRRALGDIGNLVGALNTRCVISKDGAAERVRSNLIANANKQASSSSQVEFIAVRAEVKAEAGAVWGNKQKRTNRRRGQGATVAEESNDVRSSTDSVATNEIFKTASQKFRGLSLTKSLTATSESACKDLQDLPPSIDDGDLQNQLAVVEYVEDIYKFYRKTENLSCVPPDYMSRQEEINDKMRAILIDWLIEVHLKFELMPETLYLTVNVVDRYLSIERVTRRKLQLVGLTAMFIACKYEEIWTPEIKDFVSISAKEYTRENIVAMEHTMLNRLKFNFTVPTPYVFLVRFLKAADADKQMENLAFFFAELCLLYYVLIKYSPSMIAAASVYTARCTLKKDPCWTKTLSLHTGYSEADLKECAHWIVMFYRNAGENDSSSSSN